MNYYNSTQNNLPAGYTWLIRKYQLNVLPNWHLSSINETENLWSVVGDNLVEEAYPRSCQPGDDDFAQLEFAITYDGINPEILWSFFQLIDVQKLAAHIEANKHTKIWRKIWFLYEFLTDCELPVTPLEKDKYISILSPSDYFCLSKGKRSKRQRVLNNLLGTKEFCPVIRRTDKLRELEKSDLQERCEAIVTSYAPDVLNRALTYLHKKETRSSFEIENIKPDNSRTGRFVSLLNRAGQEDFCNKQGLITLQNQVVDPRFKASDYRNNQNYVGQSVSHRKEIIHYICPKPEDLPGLMNGLLEAHKLMKNGNLPALIHAAAIAFAFVFMHPFEDGNGRIHRFLINNILCQDHFVPKGFTFPISASMLKYPEMYDRALEAFSRPLVSLINYKLDRLGQMTVLSQTAHHYRFIDMTTQAEALYLFAIKTVDEELVEELDFLNRYDKAKQRLQDIVDMPDSLLNLFITLCSQNKGILSEKKRKAHFEFLSQNELGQMEQIVRSEILFM